MAKHTLKILRCEHRMFGHFSTLCNKGLSMFSEVNVRKNSKETLPQVEKVTVKKLFLLSIIKLSIGHLPTFSA